MYDASLDLPSIIVDNVDWINTNRFQLADILTRRGFGLAFSVIPFKYIDFDGGIEESFEPKFQSFDVIGRHAPYLGYSGTTTSTFQFSAILMDEDEPGLSRKTVRAIQALTLPWLKDGDVTHRSPPEVILSIFPDSFLSVRGVLTDVKVQGTLPLIEDPFGLILGSVALDITFATTETAEQRDLFSYIERGHGINDSAT